MWSQKFHMNERLQNPQIDAIHQKPREKLKAHYHKVQTRKYNKNEQFPIPEEVRGKIKNLKKKRRN